MWFLINKPLHDLSNPNPWRLSLTVSGCQNFLSKIFLEPAPSSTSLEPAPSWSPPRSLCAIVPDHGRTPLCIGIFPDRSRWCHRPHRRHPEAHGAVPEPATPSSSPSPCYFQACDTIDPCHPWALNTVVFFDDSSNNTTLYFSTVYIFYCVQDNKLRSLMKKISRKKKQQSFIWIDSDMSSLECLYASCLSRLKSV
jgi:hypothetical protein